MIEVIEVSKSFNVGKVNQFDAVSRVSCRIAPGELTILKGPSGSGKTTLMTLIGCMARPSSGRIVLSGIGAGSLFGQQPDAEIEITSLPERFLTGIRRSAFGFIFQQFNLVRGISVLENVMLPAYPTGVNHKVLRERALTLLETFNIARHASSQVGLLSGGEMQRVAIARALINDPSVIIADEPTAHLDSRLSREFMALIEGFKSAGKTVLIASHDPIVFDSPLADQVIEMRDGALIDGSRP
ncbi:ABC transporter ATP-binding protein [Geomonas silvestris]|uniref:ABC transporter ATP-binding protein n=1 Tax=Geomonas silvestris TaxID=2740184 RepID=A0A6V8MNK3_9BACT|nr:ABC transporter ATP-binding protein [Geomonas silvestris]GFO61524.1 ABC transporter ATP-binding protein [Geomonas silvestris]